MTTVEMTGSVPEDRHDGSPEPETVNFSAARDNYRDEEEKQLILLSQRQDIRAFEELVRRNMRRAYGLAYRHVNDHHAAEDISQEAFLIAYRKIGRLRKAESFSSWLFKIILNLTRQSLRARYRKKALLSREGTDIIADRVPAGEESAEVLEQRESGDRIEAALSRLSDNQRQAFVLKHVEGWKIREIAESMGLREGTVKIHLFRAVQTLRRILERENLRKAGSGPD